MYGKIIKQRRVEKGMTQRQVADQCGITDSAFAHIERELRLPSKSVANLIVKALSLEGENLAKFQKAVKEARNRQTRERVRSRADAVVKPIGDVVSTPDADDIYQDIVKDPELLEGWRHLRKALSRRDQRKAVLSALKAWASEN